MNTTTTWIATSFGDVNVGDVLNTFQQGRIEIAAVEMDRMFVTVTTTTGRTWTATRNQLVGRLTVVKA